MYHSPSPLVLSAGTAYNPQWINIPNLASRHHCVRAANCFCVSPVSGLTWNCGVCAFTRAGMQSKGNTIRRLSSSRPFRGCPIAFVLSRETFLSYSGSSLCVYIPLRGGILLHKDYSSWVTCFARAQTRFERRNPLFKHFVSHSRSRVCEATGQLPH